MAQFGWLVICQDSNNNLMLQIFTIIPLERSCELWIPLFSDDQTAATTTQEPEEEAHDHEGKITFF